MNRIASLLVVFSVVMMFSLAGPAIGVADQFTEIHPGTLEGVWGYGAASFLDDLDNDGDLDLILAGYNSSWQPTSKIYQNNGAGFFTEINSGDLEGLSDGAVSLGDIDNDGYSDLILSFNAKSIIYRNRGTGSFEEINSGNLQGMQIAVSSSLGDIDNDGDLDLILTGFNSSFQADSRIYHNDGTGLFFELNPDNLVDMQFSATSSLGDIDNDEDLDLIITGNNYMESAVSIIYRNKGTGYFEEINSGNLEGTQLGAASSLGDIDNDGDLDLILTGPNDFNVTRSRIYRNDGTGFFTEPNPGNLEPLGFGSVSLGDIDNDGDLDLILTGVNSSWGIFSTLYLNDGTGYFEKIDPGSLAGATNSSVALGDIDNDGDLDLIITGSGQGGAFARIYQNNLISNRPPLAIDDNVSVDEDSQVVIDVLANDTDPDGDDLYIASVTTPSFGMATILGGIEIEYIPNPDEDGTDTFCYAVEDGKGENDDAVVTVTVNSVNDAPSAAAQITDGLIDPANSKTLVAKVVTFQGYNITDIDTDDANLTCEWNFGDSSPVVAGVTVTHAYASAGTFTAALTVSDNETPPAYATVNIGIVVESAVDVIDDLVTVVESFNLQQGIANSLDSKLDNVLGALSAENAGNRSDVINKLQAFINSAEAQRGNKLTEEQADELITFANDIIRSISN